MPPQVGDQVAKWRRWIDGRIAHEVLGMYRYRFIFREVKQMVEANSAVGQLSSEFWSFHQFNYAAAQALAVRRQADRDPKTRCLRVLISEMRDNAELLTRDYYVGLLGDQADNDLMVQRANQGFDRFAGTGDHLDPTIPTADIASLDRDAKLVKGFVDQHLAHTQAEPDVRIPTFADLDTAIDSVGEMFKKYAATLTGAAWLKLDEPAFQHDWKAIFRVPWIASDGD